jgi:hypothetical protein
MEPPEPDHPLATAIAAGSQIVHEADDLIIRSVTDICAAQYWFSDSNWCVVRNPWFKGYLGRGPLLLCISKVRWRDYLLAPAHQEFRNRRNRRLSLRLFVDEHSSAFVALRRLGIFWGLFPDQIRRIWFLPPSPVSDSRGSCKGKENV